MEELAVSTRVTPEVLKLKGEDWDEVISAGNPLRLTLAVPENPFCGIKVTPNDAVELGDIAKVDGLVPIENDGGGGGGGDEPPLPQLLTPATRTISADKVTALRMFPIRVYRLSPDKMFEIHNIHTGFHQHRPVNSTEKISKAIRLCKSLFSEFNHNQSLCLHAHSVA